MKCAGRAPSLERVQWEQRHKRAPAFGHGRGEDALQGSFNTHTLRAIRWIKPDPDVLEALERVWWICRRDV